VRICVWPAAATGTQCTNPEIDIAYTLRRDVSAYGLPSCQAVVLSYPMRQSILAYSAAVSLVPNPWPLMMSERAALGLRWTTLFAVRSVLQCG
jgi:hypothetical protein